MRMEKPGGAGMTGEELDAYAEQAVKRYREEQTARRKQRQAEGIAAAKARGVRFGRPQVETPSNFGAIIEAWEEKAISLETVLRICGMSQATFFHRLKLYRQECGTQK